MFWRDATVWLVAGRIYAGVAQLVEQHIRNVQVRGSIPLFSSIAKKDSSKMRSLSFAYNHGKRGIEPERALA
jgi:hypothetical protein